MTIAISSVSPNWSVVREGLYFYVTDKGKQITCCLPADVAFPDRSEGYDREKLTTEFFKKHRARIGAAAKDAVKKADSTDMVVVIERIE